MDEVTFHGKPLSMLPVSTPPDYNTVWEGDRELLGLLISGEFVEAKRRFKAAYNSAHLGFLYGLMGSVPSDEQGVLPALTQAQFNAAVDYLEGATKH